MTPSRITGSNGGFELSWNSSSDASCGYVVDWVPAVGDGPVDWLKLPPSQTSARIMSSEILSMIQLCPHATVCPTFICPLYRPQRTSPLGSDTLYRSTPAHQPLRCFWRRRKATSQRKVRLPFCCSVSGEQQVVHWCFTFVTLFQRYKRICLSHCSTNRKARMWRSPGIQFLWESSPLLSTDTFCTTRKMIRKSPLWPQVMFPLNL